MKRKIVLFDMDGVLCNYNGKLLQLAHERFNLPLYTQEDCSVFETQNIFPKEFHNLVNGLSSEKGFYESLDTIPGAVEAFHEIADENHDDGVADVFICTSPKRFENSPYSLTEKSAWVAQHLGTKFVNRIIFTRDKTVVRGHILIDDKPVISGACVPDWTHVYYDAPYNRGFKNPRVTLWRNWRTTLLPLLQFT